MARVIEKQKEQKMCNKTKTFKFEDYKDCLQNDKKN